MMRDMASPIVWGCPFCGEPLRVKVFVGIYGASEAPTLLARQLLRSVLARFVNMGILRLNPSGSSGLGKHVSFGFRGLGFKA